MTYRQDSIILQVVGVALVVRGDRFELPQERFDELIDINGSHLSSLAIPCVLGVTSLMPAEKQTAC